MQGGLSLLSRDGSLSMVLLGPAGCARQAWLGMEWNCSSRKPGNRVWLLVVGSVLVPLCCFPCAGGVPRTGFGGHSTCPWGYSHERSGQGGSAQFFSHTVEPWKQQSPEPGRRHWKKGRGEPVLSICPRVLAIPLPVQNQALLALISQGFLPSPANKVLSLQALKGCSFLPPLVPE